MEQVRYASGLSLEEFEQILSEVAEEHRQIRQATLERMNEIIEYHHMSKEHDLQAMGLTSLGAQLGHPGRNVFLHVSSDRE